MPDAADSSTLWQLLCDRPGLRDFIGIRAVDELANQMLNVAIGWYVYTLTHTPLSLAYVGLAQFLPKILTALWAGQAADRFDRRRIIWLSLLVQAVCLGAFTLWLTVEPPSVVAVYVMLVLTGTARSFASPAMSAILPHLVELEEFPRAVAAVTSAFHICTVIGPAIGGAIYAWHGPAMFALAAALFALATRLALCLQADRRAPAEPTSELQERGVLAGLHYIFSNRLLLGLISLDLFAVLLGGVTALLPIYAEEILHIGPLGLGSLRCAPSIGAFLVGVLVAHRSIGARAGRLMLWCVAGFGVATIVFAVSRDYWLSLAALIVAGGFDMVSMIVRQTMVQMSTPDAMRGRVSAVNWIFVGASNELGEFESGLTAALLGTVRAAVLGGLGCIGVVAVWTRLFPEIWQADNLLLDTPERSDVETGT